MATNTDLAAQTIRALERLRRERERWDREAEQFASQAREFGLSWGRIGAALGMSDEGARRRFGREA